MIFTPEASAKILSAISDVLMSNNGYADIGNDPEVIKGVELAGFVVIVSTNLHGLKTHKAFTQKAQDSLRASPFGESTYKTVSIKSDEPDFEAAILRRQEAYFEF